jgi:hypothetical protein
MTRAAASVRIEGPHGHLHWDIDFDKMSATQWIEHSDDEWTSLEFSIRRHEDRWECLEEPGGRERNARIRDERTPQVGPAATLPYPNRASAGWAKKHGGSVEWIPTKATKAPNSVVTPTWSPVDDWLAVEIEARWRALTSG